MYETCREDLPPFCPVCGLSAIRGLPLELMCNAKTGMKTVNGVKAFQCSVNAHVFFVRVFDLKEQAGRL